MSPGRLAQDARERARVDKRIPPNAPHLAMISTVLLVAFGIIGALATSDEESMKLLIGLIISSVPSLVAAGFAERASRDIRNGTVVEKARQGAHKALDESGVTEVVHMTQRGESVSLAMRALAQLLEQKDEKEGKTDER